MADGSFQTVTASLQLPPDLGQHPGHLGQQLKRATPTRKPLVSGRLMEPRRRLQVSKAVSEDDYAANQSTTHIYATVDSVDRKN